MAVGGFAVLASLALLLVGSGSARRRMGLLALAVAGLACAECGYAYFVCKDRDHHEALLRARKELCSAIASDIVHHQEWFLRGPSQFPLGERAAALSALEMEVSDTWRICVRKDSACGSMTPAVVGSGRAEQMDVIRRCFDEGPTPLENARLFLEN